MWFRAFDFDQDDMVGVADFLQGIVAAAAPRCMQPGSSGGLCAALALWRLLDVEHRPALDATGIEGLLADSEVSDPSKNSMHGSQQATDFEFFRASVPRLQTSSTYRLRVFGGGSVSEQ
mmetsp:Transcript_60816/g.188265  ORF Transcript_60816/g.188265 Transcript_60816/m.188265 type:complete len:119 (-) Transcript_60816:33-389(-)